MDASYKIQRGIHVHLIQFFMCPEFWVHIRMTSVLLITSAYAILGMYISPNQSSLAIAIATGVSNLGGFASAYYLNMLGIITGEKLFTPIYVLMGVYTLLATAFMVYDPLLKNS